MVTLLCSLLIHATGQAELRQWDRLPMITSHEASYYTLLMGGKPHARRNQQRSQDIVALRCSAKTARHVEILSSPLLAFLL